MILYRLEVKEPTTLQVKLEEQGSRRILYLDTLKGMAKPRDIPALQLLTKLHLKANGGRSSDTLSFQLIDLPLAHAIEAIRLMAATGELYFRSQKLVLSPKKGKIFWKGEKHSEKSATLCPFFQDGPLEAADVLMPGWAIVAGEWIELEKTVPWKWIELFRKGPLLLEGAQKKNFLEEEPPVLWKEVKEEKLIVLPQLVLSDATGSFANLWMEYPGVGRVAFEDLAPQVGGKTRLKSDEAQWEKDLLEAGFIRKAVGGSRYYCPGEKVGDTLRFLLQLGWRCFTSLGKEILLQQRCELNVEEKGAALSIRGVVHFSKSQGSLQSAMQAAAKGKHFIELDSHSVGLIDRKAIPFVEGEWKEEAIVLPRARIGDVLPLLKKEGIHWEETLRKAAEALQEGRGMASVEMSDSFHGTLLPYQKVGVEWLSFLHQWGFGALLSDEMGLGKTVQVVAFFSQLRTNLPILVVAPTSLLFHWKREIERFWLGGKQVTLVSYARLRLEQEKLQKIAYEVVVLDESQAIKTASSQTAQAAYSLNARFRIAVTGTPVENRAEELWSQFRFLLPDLLGEKSSFQGAEPESIRRKIRPFILRRSKSDVQLDLPEKFDYPVWIEMEEAQQRLYDETLSQFRSGLLQKIQVEGLQAHRMEVLEVILRLRQICADPRLFGGTGRGAKMEKLLTDIVSLVGEGKKVLIFSQFTSALRLMEKDLRELSITPLCLDGSTSAQERDRVVQQFQTEDSPHVLLLSLKAGGVGLNLTAAESVILFDPWWNEAVERQAIDRAHRIGQTRSLFVQRYLTPNTVEEKMLSLKQKKCAVADELLSDHSLSWRAEDLLHLLT